MKYIKYFLKRALSSLLRFVATAFLLLFIAFPILYVFIIGIIDSYEFKLNPNDYCNLTVVNYTAV